MSNMPEGWLKSYREYTTEILCPWYTKSPFESMFAVDKSFMDTYNTVGMPSMSCKRADTPTTSPLVRNAKDSAGLLRIAITGLSLCTSLAACAKVFVTVYNGVCCNPDECVALWKS